MTSGGVRATWAAGGDAYVVALGADGITLRSSRPWPPGARVEASVAIDPPATLRVKVHASRRQDDGTFVVEGRPLDLTRELRDKLVGML
jgi:hypothetical protein